MLFRENLDGCPPEAIEFAGRMLQRAIRVRTHLPGLMPWEVSSVKVWRLPVCHDVSHAFAEVFGGTAVDGIYIFPKSFEAREGQDIVEFTTLGHSWVEFEAGATRFILDIYPDEGCAIYPVVFLAPNPSYVYQSDKLKLLDAERLQEAEFRRKVGQIADEMRKIDLSP